MAEENYLLRGARNTLLDMLLDPIGGTYPLFDLPVKAVSDVVFYNNAAELIVSNSQPDVLYRVFEDINNPGEGLHTDSRSDLILKTGLLINQVHAFRVLATKIYSPQNSCVLLQGANIRVGVNTGLEVVAGRNLLNYGDKAVLIVKNAQKNANYSIIYYTKSGEALSVSQLMCIDNKQELETTPYPAVKTTGADEIIAVRISPLVLGNDADIRLETIYGLREDMELSVAVFDENTGLSGVLLKVTTISVMPDLNLPLDWFMQKSKTQTGAADYGSKVGLRLGNTQKSVKYQLKLEAIDSDEPLLPPDNLLSNWFVGDGDTFDILLNIPAKEDMVIVVTAQKLSDASHTGQLTSQVIIPVYPDENKKLSVVSVTGSGDKAIRLDQPQRGILYQLRNPGTKEMIDPPVFYHRNYGIGNTRVSANVIERLYKTEKIDLKGNRTFAKSLFVVDTCNQNNEAEKDMALLPVGPLADTASFEVTATKSTTGFSVIIDTVKVSI
ncbi:hypothetical protein SNE26_08215 [Mucilaginibacter sp. cycad4]|uniref:hypothetical protein n=1 Tax=Mucilaginibacter sp. cycad4 TaxID=3342096 RepID=UPI002AAB4482|nr:hypothetical protein [Mucilaginibacter gossypii]WPV01754.1 hypothetical protein SNE26_08215 [Mucilaginibacter gossypii]